MLAAVVIATALLVGPATVRAEASGSAQQARHFITHMADDVIHSLTGKDLTAHERDVRFRRAMMHYFAIKKIARWVVGRAAWVHASGAQQHAFVKTFEDLMVEIYAHRFADYQGETLKVDDVITNDNGDILVRSRITRPNSNEPLHVDWRVRAEPGGTYQVIDIIIEGLSMAQKQREEFGSFLRQHDRSLEALIVELRRRIESVRAQRRAQGS